MLDNPKSTSRTHFYQLLATLLEGELSPGEMQSKAREIAKILSAVSGVSIDHELTGSPVIDTSEGIAISPVQAAKCMEEVQRSRRFLLGITQAIEDKSESTQKINVLYAGTGPFGSILLPILAKFDSRKLKVTLLDIHRENIKAIKNVVSWLELEDYIETVIHGDALKWSPKDGRKFDIIVSETMNNFLLREPQVPIFIHLQQFLTSNGVLIPEKITIQAGHLQPVSKAQQESLKTGAKRYVPITNIFEFDQTLACELHKSGTKSWKSHFVMPESSGYLHDFEYRTFVHIYKDHLLVTGDCSLNLPVRQFNKSVEAGAKVSCNYLWGKTPEWQINYPEVFATQPLINASNTNVSGIMFLHRFWDKYRRMPSSLFNKKLFESETELDIELLKLLNLSYAEVLEFICSELPELSEFEYWISQNGIVPDAQEVASFNQRVTLFKFENS